MVKCSTKKEHKYNKIFELGETTWIYSVVSLEPKKLPLLRSTNAEWRIYTLLKVESLFVKTDRGCHFDANFNLVTRSRITVNFGTMKDESL